MKLSICTGLAVNKPTEIIYNLFLFIENVTMILRSKAFDFTTFNLCIIKLQGITLGLSDLGCYEKTTCNNCIWMFISTINFPFGKQLFGDIQSVAAKDF